MWLMKTLLTSGYTNQRGAGHRCEISFPAGIKVVNGFAKFNYWRERLIISDLPFDGADLFPEEDFTDDVSISIEMNTNDTESRLLFNPSRLKLAHIRRKLPLKKLAEITGLSSGIVIEYEKTYCLYEPTPATIAAYSKALRYPEPFFFGDDLERSHNKSLSNRSLSAHHQHYYLNVLIKITAPVSVLTLAYCNKQIYKLPLACFTPIKKDI